VRGPRSDLFTAIENAMGAHAHPMSIIISTQAPNPNDLLSVLIDDALAGNDPQVVVSLYAADDDMDPFSDEAILQANPAAGDFLNMDELRRKAKEAERMPSAEAEYRNYTLNQRVEMFAPFISRGVWDACGSPVADFEGVPVFGGLDLSSVNDLTAKVYEAPIDGKWHVRPTFWLPGDGLSEKARQDRVPYDVWAREGYLLTTPGRTVDYEFVAASLYVDCERMDVRRIAFDRWNFKHLKPWLLKAGFDERQIEGDDTLFQEFGQGFASMSPALRDLEGDLLEGRIVHGGHPVLTMCAANAVITSDPSGNRKLDKAKATGRIDGMVALAMSHAMAATFDETHSGPSYLDDNELMVL